MLYALENGKRIMAHPGARASCPTCGNPVRAKCGMIKLWHWAHLTNDCDPWSEGITQWHIDWQRRFNSAWREVNIARKGESHRADICTPSGIVVELQHSSISPQNIASREKFYGPLMRWVFDAREAFTSERLSYSLRWTDKRELYVALRWKHPRVTLGHARRPIYLDIGEEILLKVAKLDLSSPCRGWGFLTNHKSFVAEIEATT